ncbi:MAG TPA: efflux RND transporter permease subunit [Stellaceae bacterium]|nr:efflux RND transporter permease subunit [Stellaceae bacterium]
MNPSAPFIRRPVATTLLTIGLALAGCFAYFKLPVAPLPQVDFPTISVTATMPGASPDTMATTVATPLERHLGVIADVSEMTSSSTVGTNRITLQFNLDRNIDGAARDVEAAINAARVDLPTSLRQNPTYRKVNPADAPIAILSMTSDTLTRGQIYDAASTIMQQALSQIDGIGQVAISGSSLPAVRVELTPQALFKYGIGLEDVRAALSSANAHSPKGALEDGNRRYQIYTNDQASKASAYRPLVIAYRNGAAVRLTDVGQVLDSVENLRNQGLSNGQPAVLVILYRQPGANIIDTVDRVKAVLPQLQASIPHAINVYLMMDRTTTIRTSLHDVERALLIAIALVILVVFLFLRNLRATLIPSVAVPVSLVGTFGAMWLLGYSLDNLSLMALTVSTGFVVDDAIVVLENITRHIEAGMTRMEAALLGAREVGFTVLSMSLSLIAVFAPILLMGGIVGRLFREFAMTLSVAILISLVVSLTTTPMMCAYLLADGRRHEHGRLYRAGERAFDAVLGVYDRSLRRALRWPGLVMLSLAATIALAGFLFTVVPKGFFPQQDTGRMIGGIQADQSISFQLMQQKLTRFVDIIRHDPAVENIVGFTGGGQTNSGFVFVTLKPLSERKISVMQVIGRLRPKLNEVAGARLFLQAVQDIWVGGRQSNAQYQYTLQGDDSKEIYKWSPKVEAALQKIPLITEVNLDQQQKGLESDLVIDRSTAARLGLNVAEIDNTLYDAFGQRQVSVIYAAQNQYHVVMEVAPQYWQNPQTLNDIYVSTSGGTVSGTQSTNAIAGTVAASSRTNPAASSAINKAATAVANAAASAAANPAATAIANLAASTAANNAAIGSAAASTTASAIASDTERNQQNNALANTGHGATSSGAAVATAAETMVPLSAFSHFGPGNTPLAVNHQSLFVASTISFNLAPGASLSQAQQAIDAAVRGLGMPATVHGSFQGTAKVFEQSLANEPILIAAALLAVYIVLGVLYESYVHPITILSTLPSAGVGAILALIVTDTEFSIIALIGVILLIGIVKKNAIMMIDFALDAERSQGLSSREAIYRACLKRFRPIMMTTLAAMLGALPLAIGFGEGAELRRPLGISIVGGLMVSQVLTLYTTPVIYLYLDRFRLWAQRQWRTGQPRLAAGQIPEPGE